MPHTLLYFFALFCLSTSPNWAKLNQMPVEVLGFWRLSLASLALGGWVLFKKYRRTQSKDSSVLLPFDQTKIQWVVLSGFLFFLHLATYKFAAKNTTISNTMILFATNPIWASLGAVVFFKERLHPRIFLAYGLAVLGILILVFKNLQFDHVTFKGDLSSILSAFFYAAYMLTGKKARRHFDNSIYALIQYTLCAVCFGLTNLITQHPWLGYSDLSWLAVLGLVILPTLFGHLSLTYLVSFMSLTRMTCGKLIEPVLATIIAYFVFHESLSLNNVIAFVLTATAVFILFGPELLKTRQKI